MTPNIDPTPASGGEAPVDFEQLRGASGDDPGLLRELVTLYFDQAKDIMPNLDAAVKKGAASEVDYLAHKLVGASLACGMSLMVAPLRELETRGRKGDLTGAEALLTQSKASLEIVRAAIDSYLANPQ